LTSQGVHDDMSRLSPVQWFRYLSERFVLIPAATYLPAAVAFALADGVALFDTLLTPRGWGMQREVATTHGSAGTKKLLHAWRCCRTTYRDIVDIRRIAARRERPEVARVVQTNSDAVEAMLRERRPFLVAWGHFGFSARLRVMYHLAEHQPLCLGMEPPPPGKASDPAIKRYQLRRKNFLDALRFADIRILPIGMIEQGERVSGTRELLRNLKSGGISTIAPDAPWDEPGGYERSFAGYAKRAFALGPVRIARSARCPIVCVSAVWDADRSVRVDWSEAMECTGDGDIEAQLEPILDWLESAVGRYREHYLASTGSDRRWNETTGSWVVPETQQRTSAASAPSEAARPD
jgi:lauroyl/myristoyl acyltransferase